MRKRSAIVILVIAILGQANALLGMSPQISNGQTCSVSQLGKIVTSGKKTFVCKKTTKGRAWTLKSVVPPTTLVSPASTAVATTTTQAPPKTYTGSTAWGEVTITAITPPPAGQCSDIPIRIDIRGKVGLGFGLIVSAEDSYQNQVGEMTRLTTDQQLGIGVNDYTIKVCRDPWVFTYPSGVTLALSAVKYCGLKIKFFPYQSPITYTFAGC